MSGVDNRVVKITFDNSSFKKNIQDTIDSLKRLKDSITFDKAKIALGDLSKSAKNADSFDFTKSKSALKDLNDSAKKADSFDFTKSKKAVGDLNSSINKFDPGPINTTLQGISTSVVAWGSLVATTVSGVLTSVAGAGINIAKALTITPALAGFQEYELNMSSIQTILANTESKGETLETVNSALDELNEYSDKTIYNFSQMAKNIGTFTAAGVDLDTSVQSIKGIANLAAISGSSSEQASSAMYQLSQALAAGKLGLQDWNSVVASGMGGEIFKNSLFETAKAMGTIAGVPIDQSFEEWENSGNNFRLSLEKGWITADVLSTTLAALSGDLSGAELSAKGFSDAQIVAIQKTADTAIKAATEIKTASQLIDVVKEALGTGLASTFRIVVGDFAEAKTLFSGFGNAISNSIQGITQRRNELLNAWKAFGGRNAILEGILYALNAIKSVLAPIREAFRSVFPPVTATTLLTLSAKFRDFAAGLKIGGETANRIKSVFAGLFSIFKIGIAIITGVFGVLKNLFGVLFNLVGSFSGSASSVGNFVTKLQEMLVAGGGIDRFFGIINSGVQKLGEFITTAREKIGSLFGGDGEAVPGGEKASGVISTILDKLSGLSSIGDGAKNVIQSLGDAFKNGFEGIKNAFETIGDYISNFFGTIGDRISSVFTADAFAPALATVAVGLFGGLVYLIRKFVNDGLKLDFGLANLLESFSGAIDEVGNTLKAFQAEVKANALLKIAIAVAVLTASIIALSFIEPTKIATSLGAVAGGIGAMVGALALLSKIEMNPVKLAALAASMSLLGIAMLTLTISITILARLDPAQLATGLAGVAASLGLLLLFTKNLDDDIDDILKVSFSLGVLGASMVVMSLAIKSLGSMDIKSLATGLIGLAATLGIFVVAMKKIDNSDVLKISVSLGILGVGFYIISKAIGSLGSLSWDQLLLGFAGFIGILAALVITLKKVPKNLDKIGLGLLLVSGAVYILSKSVESLAGLSLGDLVKGLVGLAAVLLILVVATNAMQGSLAGAAAIIIVSGALYVLAQVIETIGKLSLAEIGKSLLGIAGVFLVLGLAAAALTAFPPLLLALLGLGVALTAIGVAFALFGVGAKLFAEALQVFSNVGPKALETFSGVLDTVAQALPNFIKKMAEGFIELIKTLLDAAPELVDGFANVLLLLLDKVIELAPKIGQAIGAILDVGLQLLREKVPLMITVGLELLTAFLNGINDNIELITTLALSILTNFINGLTNGIPLLIEAAVNFITTLVNSIAANIQPIIDAGVNLIVQLINGIRNGFVNIATAVTDMITEFITQAGNNAERIATAGTDALVSFLNSISGNTDKVITAVADLIKNLIFEIGQKAGEVATAGKDAAIDFLDGLVDNAIDFADKAGAMILKLLEGLTAAVEKYSQQIRDQGLKLAGALIDGMTGGLASKAREVADKARELAGQAVSAIGDFIGWGSPAKLFIGMGKDIGSGLVIGLSSTASVEKASKKLAKSSVDSFKSVLSNVAYGLEEIGEFNPTITPVLDLSNVQKDAAYLGSILGTAPMSASLSYGNARYISTTTDLAKSVPVIAQASTPGQVTFEQNIYSPTALSTNDIYRNTRSQIALAKEELNIP